MEIKEGMYVRTKDGVIGKIQSKNYVGYGDFIIDTLYYNFDEIIDRWTCGINKYDVKKPSFKVIDLIEEDDYVNGFLITKIKEKDRKYIVDICNNVIYNEDIKSIVTKEQFEQMEYKL